MRIQDKVFVVTGGGNGIGRQVVLDLLGRGARVAALDLREDGLEETRRLAYPAGDRLSTHVVDVTDRRAVEDVAQKVVAEHGHVDGLLNVAGIIQKFVPVVELDEAEMERVMNVNFWGVVHTTKAFLPLLLERPGASIVNVSSMGALAPVPGQAVYGASKAAVKLFTEALYAETRTTPVRVTVVFPGGVATDIAAHSGVVSQASAGTSRGSSMSPTTPQGAARQIVDAVEHEPFRVVIGSDARTLDTLTRLSPRRATDYIADKMASLVAK
jgi:NAD(P)-dependent dehydrogenase (short-subunit alcohol dehydrogenase family)